MSKADVVRTSDVQKLKAEILAEVASHFDATLGEAIVGRILGRASERAAHVQKAQLEAETARDLALREVGLLEDRVVRTKGELGEISKQRNSLEAEVTKLTRELDDLAPRVSALRAEQESYRTRVAKIAG